MKNDRFEAYYKAQKIIPEQEWDLFLDTLRQPLPTTFRVAGNRQCVNAYPSLHTYHSIKFVGSHTNSTTPSETPMSPL